MTRQSQWSIYIRASRQVAYYSFCHVSLHYRAVQASHCRCPVVLRSAFVVRPCFLGTPRLERLSSPIHTSCLHFLYETRPSMPCELYLSLPSCLNNKINLPKIIDNASSTKGSTPCTLMLLSTLANRYNQACEHCRTQKARCLWNGGSTTCIRCERIGHKCSGPAKTSSSSTTAVTAATTTAESMGQLQLNDPWSSITGSTGPINSEICQDPSSALSPQRYLFQQQPTPESTSFHLEPDFNAGSSFIRIATTRPSSVPPLPERLPVVGGSCTKDNCYLPPAEEGRVLLQEYLHDFNSNTDLLARGTLCHIPRLLQWGGGRTAPRICAGIHHPGYGIPTSSSESVPRSG